MPTLEERYKACILLHALGDTIGFRNTKWEFYGHKEFARQKALDLEAASEILYEFIAIGGINGIDFKGWYVSDDTLLHKDVVSSLVEAKQSKKLDLQNIIELVTAKFIKTKHKYFDNRVNIDRAPGHTTIKYIEKLKLGEDIVSYNKFGGGNGAAMRSPVIGLVYHNDLASLIRTSIEIGKLTHNSPIGYLGALNTAFFVYLALKGTHLHKWPYELVELLESKTIIDIINKDADNQRDYTIFLNKWKKYIELRFDADAIPQSRRSFMNLKYRIQFYSDNFVDQEFNYIPGESGYLVNIMAYDSLLDAEDKWEKLVVYSMLHIGDSDTVGCIAASWFGAKYGFSDVPKSNLTHLEFGEELTNLASEVYKLFK